MIAAFSIKSNFIGMGHFSAGFNGADKRENYGAPSAYIYLLVQAVDILDTTIRHIVTNIDDTVITDYVTELQNDTGVFL
jgi:hypothetical protein